MFAEDLEMMDYSEENYRIPKDPLLTKIHNSIESNFRVKLTNYTLKKIVVKFVLKNGAATLFYMLQQRHTRLTSKNKHNL